MISIVTPWLDHAELIADYERAVSGVAVVIVNTGSKQIVREQLEDMCDRIGGWLVSMSSPFSFAAACNYGAARAVSDIVMFLNSDIQAAPGWLDAVARDVRPGALYGPAVGVRVVAGQPMVYIEGWCVAAHRETWDALGGFDAETFKRPYWEDVDLSWRAVQMGYKLIRRPWSVTHIGGGNTTARTTPGAYDGSEANRQAFERKVRAAMVAA